MNTSVMRKTPNRGMNFFVDAPVCRSNQASSQGEPTRRIAVNGCPVAPMGSTFASMAASARSRSAGELTCSSSANPK